MVQVQSVEYQIHMKGTDIFSKCYHSQFYMIPQYKDIQWTDVKRKTVKLFHNNPRHTYKSRES